MKSINRCIIKHMGRIMATLALTVTVLNMNVNCLFLVHQPEIPEEAKKLRKF